MNFDSKIQLDSVLQMEDIDFQDELTHFLDSKQGMATLNDLGKFSVRRLNPKPPPPAGFRPL